MWPGKMYTHQMAAADKAANKLYILDPVHGIPDLLPRNPNGKMLLDVTGVNSHSLSGFSCLL